jgi:dienelactone hydrolase
MGGSYGGYATLAGVTFTPDLYAAAVAIVAPSNLNTLLGSIPPYWEQIRVLFNKRMGDPSTPEGKAQLERQSPLNHVEKIKTPLMIVQGANDPRVKKAEADQIVIALRERNYPVEYLLADDEGHGFARPVNNMAMFAEAEKFLAKYLGGRYQESVTPEVEKRLKEITVDVKTVQMAKPAASNSSGLAGKWTMTVDLPDGPVPVALDLKQNGDAFEGSMSSPHGNGVVQKGKVSGSSVTGQIVAEIQGQQMEFQIDGKLEGGKMTGSLSGAGMALPFSAVRAAN